MKSKIASWHPSLLTLAVSALLLARPSHAALTATAGDIFVAFRSDNAAVTQSLVVDIGSFSQFSATGTSTVTVTPSNAPGLLADLNGTFGNDWSTQSGLHWSLFGTVTGGIDTNFSSKVATAGTLTTAWTNTQTTSAIDNAVGSNITAVFTDYKNNGVATTHSGIDYLQNNSSAAASYSGEVTTAGRPAFGIGSTANSGWTPISSFEGNFGSGTSLADLDLFRQNTTAIVNLGQFAIDNSGDITFTPAALLTTSVPEPSRALLGLIGLSAVMFRRRRASTQAPCV